MEDEQRWWEALDKILDAETGICTGSEHDANTIVQVPVSVARQLRPGAQVLVEHLPQSLDHFNGRIGICEDNDFMTGSWTVWFDDNTLQPLPAEYLTVQVPSLRAGAYVRLEGLQSRNEVHLNGHVGVCEGLDPESLLWRVCLETGGPKRLLSSENLVPYDSYRDKERRVDESDRGIYDNKFTDRFEDVFAS